MLTLDDINTAAGEDTHEAMEKDYPAMVPGRVAHIDADFLAYMASYEKEGEENDWEGIQYRTDVMIDDKRRQAGAEYAVLHVTPKHSDKGGRYAVAIQKQYQGQRSSDRKPVHLEACREYMAAKRGPVSGVAWDNAEADDGMAEAAWKAFYAGEQDTVVIVTKDKDLRMCPGHHLNWDSGIIHTVEGTFGHIEIIERVGKTGKITKKHGGYGTKFFWFQLLMGDTADNIKGCPKADIGGKHKACGLVGAYSLLRDAATDRECLRICMDAYKTNTFTHYLTGEPASWQDVFWSEAQMLWMQRNPGDINDVKDWVKNEVLK